MKSIRIKIRTLIIFITLILVVFIFSDNIYWSGIKLANTFLDEDHQVDYMALSTNSLEDENARLELILSDHTYNLYNLVTIGEGMSFFSSRIRNYDANNVLKTFEAYSEKEPFKNYPDYTLNVILIQWFSGNTETVFDLLNQMDIKYLNDLQKDHYYLIKAATELTYYDLESLEITLNHVSDAYKEVANQIKMYIKKAYDYDIVYEDHLFQKNEYNKYESFFTGVYQSNESFRQNNLETSEDSIRISGRVTINGEPYLGALLYDKYYKGFSSSEGFGSNTVNVDTKGDYELLANSNVKGMGLKIPWQLIHDKKINQNWRYEFKNEAVINYEFTEGLYFKYAYIEDDSFYYEIVDEDYFDGKTYIMKIRNIEPEFINDQSYIELHDQSGIIDLDDIHRRTQILYGRFYYGEKISMRDFSEPLYLTGKYYFSVNQKASEGTYFTNGINTDALNTVVEYIGETYNKGDLLLDKGRIEEAIEWYSEHPTRHNLKVLIGLYTEGTKPVEKKYGFEYEGEDYEKAIQYTKQLIELGGEDEVLLLGLARLYNELRDYKHEYDVLTQLLTYSDESYYNFMYGKNLINRGYFDDGIKRFLEKCDMVSYGNRFLPYLILANDLEPVPSDMKHYLEAVDRSDYEIFYDLIRNGAYENAYRWLRSQEESDLKSFYELIYSISFNFDFIELPYEKNKDIDQWEQFMNSYVEITKAMKNNNLKQVLILIKEPSNWF